MVKDHYTTANNNNNKHNFVYKTIVIHFQLFGSCQVLQNETKNPCTQPHKIFSRKLATLLREF